jgi:hypothetical protein
MHNAADSIALNGNAKWIINPLSLFGLFPASYPSGGMFLTSTFSQMGGISIPITILLECIALSVIGVLAAFILAREINRDNDLFAIILALIFSLAPKFLTMTIWELPSRSLFMAFTPIFIWALLYVHKTPSIKNIAILVVTLIMLASFHRLAILMLIIVLTYIMSFIFLTFIKILKLKYPNVFLKPRIMKRILIISLVLLLLGAFFLILSTNILDSYEYGKLAIPDSPSIPISILNLGVSLARSTGILLPLALLGIVGFIFQKNKGLKEVFLVFTLLGLIPTLFLRVYTGYYVITFFAIFIAVGIIFLFRVFKRRRKIVYVCTTIFLVGSVGFSAFMIGYDIQEGMYISSDEYNAGLYSSYRIDGTVLSNEGLAGSRVSAIAGRPYLPIGGATLVFSGPELLAYDFYTPDELDIVQIPLEQLDLNSDSPFALINVQMQDDWFRLISNDLDVSLTLRKKGDNRTLFERYNIQYGLESKLFYSEFNHYGAHYSSGVLLNAHESRYKVYEGSGEILWFLT